MALPRLSRVAMTEATFSVVDLAMPLKLLRVEHLFVLFSVNADGLRWLRVYVLVLYMRAKHEPRLTSDRLRPLFR